MPTGTKTVNFPAVVRFRAEPGLAGAVRNAARLQRTSPGEYLRRAVRERIATDGVDLADFDGRALAGRSLALTRTA